MVNHGKPSHQSQFFFIGGLLDQGHGRSLCGPGPSPDLRAEGGNGTYVELVALVALVSCFNFLQAYMGR